MTRLSCSSYTRVISATGSTDIATVDCNQLAASDAVYHRIAIAPGILNLTPAGVWNDGTYDSGTYDNE